MFNHGWNVQGLILACFACERFPFHAICVFTTMSDEPSNKQIRGRAFIFAIWFAFLAVAILFYGLGRHSMLSVLGVIISGGLSAIYLYTACRH